MPISQSISDSELEIMQIIWKENNRILFSPLMEALEKQGRQWKANTVLTFLSRLAEKGMIRVEKQGRLNEYIALISEKDYLNSITRSFVTRAYGGNAKGLVAALLRQDYLTKQDINELQRFWEEEKDK